VLALQVVLQFLIMLGALDLLRLYMQLVIGAGLYLLDIHGACRRYSILKPEPEYGPSRQGRKNGLLVVRPVSANQAGERASWSLSTPILAHLNVVDVDILFKNLEYRHDGGPVDELLGEGYLHVVLLFPFIKSDVVVL